MGLFFDGNSTGFAIRDFQLALERSRARPPQDDTLYCDARFLKLFGTACPDIRLMAYPPARPDKPLTARCQPLAVLRKEKDLLPCGIQKPEGYLNFMGSASDLPSEFTRLPSAGQRTIFCIVSGLKPESEEGGDDPASRRMEGQRQTFPFAEIAKIMATTQNAVGHRVHVMPVSVQYGAPDALITHFAQVSANSGLHPPIYHPSGRSALRDFYAKARFMAALCAHNHANGFPPLAVGNASTYGHLLLALAAWHRYGGRLFVALDSFQGTLRAKNRAYWQDLSAQQLGGVHVFAQPDEAPGQWAEVTEQMAAALTATINEFS